MALMDMKMDSLAFPSSSSSAARRKYDVFLSFRGEDTRFKFMGHLYQALIQKGIVTFKDDEKLERGKTISPELLKAIEESKFAIVILSENYASSTWCLDELAKIIRCKNETRMTVLPVFHYVEPSDVRNQMGTFEQAFVKHEEKENKERVEKWKDALTQVGDLAGWQLKDDCSEIENIKDIVGWISLHLKYDALPYITKDLVGIYSRMEELESRLALGSNDVRFIGIWGMGGMGKTTLARVVYYMVSVKFEDCSFIEDVREKSERDGLVGLQQKLISNILMETDLKIRDKYDGVIKIRNRLCCKRILLVLDDVDKLDQLKFLVGEHDWFGPGSRIIITTRDEHVLIAHNVKEIYEVNGLNHEHSLQLFLSKAFKNKHVPDDYLELSDHFLDYASGLPLALEVLGSFLVGKNIVEWESALERLKEFPEDTVLQVLKISFNGLCDKVKEIFLHIACFFNHWEKDCVLEILDSLGLYPVIGLKELTDKSLLKIMDENMVWMHDLLEEMGRDIVRHECLDDPGKRSRLWCYEDIENVLKNNKGIEVVQAMHILRNFDEDEDEDDEDEDNEDEDEDEDDGDEDEDEDEDDEDEDEVKEICWSPKAISQMYNLKFLRIDGIFHDPQHLPNSLRVLCWRCYPSNSLPSTVQLDELVMLCLPQSKIEQLWIGTKNFDKMKFIDLSESSLSISPDFIGVPNLKKLTLSYCQNLRELDTSIGILKKLVLLHLNSCKNLMCLPDTICNLKSLECLDLSRCSNIDNLPENLGNLKGLKKLDLSGTAIKELPSSIEDLTALTLLALKDCKNLVCLPSAICCLKLLEYLDLSGCSNCDNLPENLGNLKGLKKLYLSGTAIKELPSSIEDLTALTLLALKDCKNLVCLPSAICCLKLLEYLDLSGCSNCDNLPENLGNLKGLKKLYLSRTAIKELPSSIEGLTALTLLTLKDCKNLVCLPSAICCLKLLERLNLSGCSNFDNLPENIGNLKGLKNLNLSETAIKELPSSIERLTSLASLSLFFCHKLECLPSTNCGFKFRADVDIFACYGLKNLPENPWMIEGLGELYLCSTAIEELPSSIERLTNLTILNLRYCVNFVRLPKTICNLTLLKTLDLFGCLKFDNLPENIGNMEGLEVLNLYWTAIKEVPPSIVFLKNLKVLRIRGWKLSEFNSQPASLELMDPLWILSLYLSEGPTTKRILLPSFIYYSLPTSLVPVGLSLPFLSGLQSLTDLHISHCDLSLIPNDIGCLSSLVFLDLSGNNFVSLPESMSQLSNLRKLYLEGCKRLQSLENVPSNIDSVIGDDCTSLERLPELQFYQFRSDRTYLQFLFLNCFKLVDNIQSVNNMLQGQSGSLPPGKLNIIIPGSEIPKYFNQESTGHELDVQLPSNSYSVLMGIALCVVFVPNKRRYKHPCDWELSFKMNGLLLSCGEYLGSRKEYGTIESHHLWLTYYSNNHLSHPFFSIWKGNTFNQFDPNGIHQLTIRAFSQNLEVEKIGVRFIYRQDIEYPSKTMAQWINNSSIVIHHDVDDSIAEGSGNKRSRDEDDDGAGPSGECCSIVEPPPKRIQRLGGFIVDFEDSGQREFFDFFAMEGENQTSKNLEAIHEGSSYQVIEDLNLTMAQSSNSSMLYEDLAKTVAILNDSATERSKNKQNCHEDDGVGPSGEGSSNEEPQPNWIYKVGEFMADCEESSQREIFDFFAMEGEYEMSKTLESIHGGKRDSYQDIEDPNQTMTQLSINSSTLSGSG